MPGGRLAFCEVKARGEKPRPLQVHRMEQLRELGFRVYVVDCEEQIGGMIPVQKSKYICMSRDALHCLKICCCPNRVGYVTMPKNVGSRTMHGVFKYDRRNWLADQSVPARQQGTVLRPEPCRYEGGRQLCYCGFDGAGIRLGAESKQETASDLWTPAVVCATVTDVTSDFYYC